MVCNLGRWVRSLAYAIGSRVQPVAECAAMFVHSISITKCSDEKGPNPVELQLLFLCFFMHHLVAFCVAYVASSMVHFIAPSTPFLLRMEIWRFALCPWFLHSHRLHERCTGGDWLVRQQAMDKDDKSSPFEDGYLVETWETRISDVSFGGFPDCLKNPKPETDVNPTLWISMLTIKIWVKLIKP